MRFTDVTDAAGVRGVGYAMGAAAADYDNDGHVDLFVAGVRRNQLLHNRGDGRFEDVTKQAGIASGEWAVAGGWFDYDNDGRLDLLVVQLRAVVARHEPLLRRRGARHQIYCDPRAVPGAAQPSVPQPWRRHVRGRLGARRAPGARRQRDERRHSPTSITTAVSMCSSPTTPCPTSCSTTTATARLPKTALLAGVSVTDSGRPISEHGHRLPGLRQRRLGGYSFDGALRRNVSALPQRLARRVRRGDAGERPGAAHASSCRGGARSWRTSTTTAGRTSSPPTRTSTIASAIFRPSRSSNPTALFVNDGHGHFSDASAAVRTRRRRRLPIAAAEWPTSTATAVSTSSVLTLGTRPNCGRTRVAVEQLADRPAGRNEEQPRRHRRASCTWAIKFAR